MDLLDHGDRKFSQAWRLTPADLGRRGIAAELRSHPGGDSSPFRSDQREITIAIAGSRDAVVNRKGACQRQATRIDHAPAAILDMRPRRHRLDDG